ncbi:Hypothetical predicted protein [Mytilus galloprovincialis]|uniref:Uncharacterized protein n=1 Tax=Mytilus galloprovincialis TaxID=29158 RepID=A0A8B6HGN8_MYTGA|nr:Hypothetical predicted protein [Mytilus galloprovincialis]
MPENSGSEYCPVSSFEKYVNKLNPECDKLWQRPKDQFWEEDPSWYYNIPVGEKTLGNFMSYLSKKCNLSEIYTNHSIRATGATVLAKNSYCNAQIMAVTGHKSVASLSLYQRVDNDDKIRMGQTLTESITEPSKALALTAGETSSNIRALPSSSCTVPPKTLAIAPSTFLPLPNITTASTTLMSTERSSVTYNVGQKTLYTSAKEHKAPPLPFSGPLPCNTFKPKHLSTTQQGNSTQSFNESLQGVNLIELFNDFTETAVNINRTTLCPQVFNNCSVTIVYKKRMTSFLEEEQF